MDGTVPQYDDALYARCLAEYPGQLVVRLNGEPVKTRRFIVVTSFSLTNTLGVYVHCVAAVVSALLERFFYIKGPDGIYRPPPQPLPGIFKTPRYCDFRRRVLACIPAKFPRLTRQQCVDGFSGLKRRRYLAALDSLNHEPLTRADARIRMFCKFSKTKLGDAARIISPREARFNLELARYTKHLEKRIYRAINKCYNSCTDHTVMKGLNVDTRAAIMRKKWDSFDDPIYLSLDATKLDASIGVSHLKYEHSFYVGVYPWSRSLRTLLCWMRVHNCVAYAPDGMVLLNCPARRASGDVTTSLGNVIIMTSIIWALVDELRMRVEVSDDGDDAGVMMERCDFNRFRGRIVDHFLDAGLTLKIEQTTDVFEEIVFCQHNVVCVDGEWRMVREVRKVVQKDTICLIDCPKEKVFRAWLGAVSLAGTHLTDGVPVLHSYYRMLARNGRPPSNKFFDHVMQHTFFLTRKRKRVSKITPSTRVSFYLATGLTPDVQEELECWFDGIVFEELGDQGIDQRLLPVYQGGHLELLA